MTKVKKEKKIVAIVFIKEGQQKQDNVEISLFIYLSFYSEVTEKEWREEKYDMTEDKPVLGEVCMKEIL